MAAAAKWFTATSILAFAFPAYAGSDANCTLAGSAITPLFITSQEDADALSICPKLTTDIYITNASTTLLTLNGIESIDGDLVVSSCDGLAQFSAPALAKIGGNFNLSGLPSLTDLEFPLLDNIGGGVYWDSVPLLTVVSFGNLRSTPSGLPGANVDGNILISETGLSDLIFLNFTHYSEPDFIWIKGNGELGTANLTGLSWGSNSLAITDNKPSVEIFLSDLQAAGALTITGAGGVHLPLLSSINTDMILSNNSFSSFISEKLTSIGGSFIVSNNEQLMDLNLPSLTSIGDVSGKGDFVVANNSALSLITHMNQLLHTQGNINLTGDFANVTFPSLRTIVGGFHLNSAESALDCTAFDKLAREFTLSSSQYSCGAYLPGSSTDVAKHYHPSDRGSSLSKVAENIIIIISVVAGLLFIALLLQLWRRGFRRGLRRGSRRSATGETIDLGSLASRGSGGVVRNQSEDYGLPAYRKEPKPGEVPPSYQHALPVGAETAAAEASNVNIGASNDAVQDGVPDRLTNLADNVVVARLEASA